MNNAEVIQHNGKDVLILDIANVKPVDVIKRIKAVEEKIVEFPLGSVNLFVLAAHLSYNSIVSSNLDDLSDLYGKYINLSVIVDESANLPDGTSTDTSNGLKVFADKNAALDWLTSN